MMDTDERQRRRVLHQTREPPPKPQQKLDTAPAATSQGADWEAWLRTRPDQERAVMIEAVGQALGQSLRQKSATTKRELASEVKRLRTELIAADETITELRKTIDELYRAIDHNSGPGEVIDLPARHGVN